MVGTRKSITRRTFFLTLQCFIECFQYILFECTIRNEDVIIVSHIVLVGLFELTIYIIQHRLHHVIDDFQGLWCECVPLISRKEIILDTIQQCSFTMPLTIKIWVNASQSWLDLKLGILICSSHNKGNTCMLLPDWEHILLYHTLCICQPP